MGTLRDDLGRTAEDVRETHISWVFLAGDDVYKVKKPVDLGFLDFSNLDKRRDACDAEVALNSVLSPDVYRGVVAVTRDADGVHHIGGRGAVVDFAVHMRRLADEDRLDAMLARGALDDRALAKVATAIARFHEVARRTKSQGGLDAVRGNVLENFAQTRDTIHAHVSPAEAAEIERYQLAFLEEHAARFEARTAHGFVRDGHGDLRLDQIYLEGGAEVRILDRIEFNERFRFGDTCADVAFLSMDLAHHGRVDLAERFLALYAREANDFDLFPLVDFYESYRAYVRAKVSTMLAADETAEPTVRERAASQARRYYLLARAAEEGAVLPPRVVAVGGVIASGKSTVSDRLSSLLGAPVVETDRTRKHMLGAKPTEKLHEGTWSGAYDPAFTEEVYDEVYRRAKSVLTSGRPVILDASFRSPSMRARARALAVEHGVPFTFVECVAPRDVCLARLAEREKGESVSDGRVEIFDAFVARFEPVGDGELPDGEHVVLDTSGPLDDSLRAIGGRLPTWEGLNA